MAKNTYWDAEAEAGALLAVLLRGRWAMHDLPTGPDSMYDVDVWTVAGDRVAVEVTIETDGATNAQHVAEGSRSWEFEKLSGHWSVKVFDPARAADIHRRLPEILRELESAGIQFLETARHEPSDALHRELQALRVKSVHRLLDVEPGVIDLSAATVVGSSSALQIIRAVESHASREDNIVKLGLAVDATERHLFIWANSSRIALMAALRGSILPIEPPQVSGVIDVVWIAPMIGDLRTALQWSRTLGWGYVHASA